MGLPETWRESWTERPNSERAWDGFFFPRPSSVSQSCALRHCLRDGKHGKGLVQPKPNSWNIASGFKRTALRDTMPSKFSKQYFLHTILETKCTRQQTTLQISDGCEQLLHLKLRRQSRVKRFHSNLSSQHILISSNPVYKKQVATMLTDFADEQWLQLNIEKSNRCAVLTRNVAWVATLVTKSSVCEIGWSDIASGSFWTSVRYFCLGTDCLPCIRNISEPELVNLHKICQSVELKLNLSFSWYLQHWS